MWILNYGCMVVVARPKFKGQMLQAEATSSASCTAAARRAGDAVKSFCG